MEAALDIRHEEKAQRVDARARFAVTHDGRRTRVARLFQEGAAKIRWPRSNTEQLEAVLINTAGGLTGGDQLSWSFNVGSNAALSLTTQACEKLYRASSGTARVAAEITVGDGGRIDWLPQETILFDGAALRRTLDADLAPSARGLFVEATIFGRRAMGETVRQASMADRWRIRCGGRLVHGEDLFIGGDVEETLARRATANAGRAVATVLLVGEDAPALCSRARAIVGDGGVSAWEVGGYGKLLARLVAGDGYELRKRLVPLIGLLSGQAAAPKLWSL